jgi:hypothetical protein
MIEVHHGFARLHLRIGEDLPDIVDRAGRQARRLEGG